MPTPGERKALLFLAGVAVLGGVVRMAGLRRDARPLPAEELAALDRQLAAADSAARVARADRAGKGGGKRSPRPRKRSGDASPPAPPAPRSAPPPTPRTPLDLDRATATEIDALPGVGPSLARRIVAWRDSAGGLGSLETLDCVRGVGPSLLVRLQGHVTFSGPRRPPCVLPPAGPAPRRARAL